MNDFDFDCLQKKRLAQQAKYRKRGSKSKKCTPSDFSDIDFTAIQLSNWTKDEHTNELIRALVKNFLKKYKELDAELKRKKLSLIHILNNISL